ncbi:hypothetical protein G6F56_005999 [Rhizopus delemar]|nr:hypothetical protein G6F56_005999 [Rhizopus delemar]
MLDEYDDPTIQDIYNTALDIFSFDKDTTNDLTQRTESFCDAMAIQFAKILKYKKDYLEKFRKRLHQYAEDNSNIGNFTQNLLVSRQSEQ